MRIMGTSFFFGIATTIILSITLFSITIYDILYHRIHNVIKYLFFILIGILLISIHAMERELSCLGWQMSR